MLNSDSVLSPNERVITAVLAIILHIFFGVLLLFPVWERPVPAPEPAGITMVSFGNVITPTETPAPTESQFVPSIPENEVEEITTETIENVQEETVSPVTNTENKTETSPNIKTTENENTVSVPEKKKDKKEEKQQEDKTEKKEDKKPVKKQEEKQPTTPKTETTSDEQEQTKQNENTSVSNEKGDAQTKDKQGNSDNPEDKGQIGTKEGTELQVVGWRWITKPQPNDVLNEQGTIVFKILIDTNGNVIKTSLVSKSPTIGISTYSAYKSAIEETKFERTLATPATEPSSGQITFRIRVGK